MAKAASLMSAAISAAKSGAEGLAATAAAAAFQKIPGSQHIIAGAALLGTIKVKLDARAERYLTTQDQVALVKNASATTA